jgi:four helix bundle protein
MQNPDNLYVHREARALIPDVYQFIDTLPPTERLNLAHQMRRSSTSIRDNIRDGCGRQSNRAMLPYLWDSRASAGELVGQLQQALDVRVGRPGQARRLKRRAAHLRASIFNLIRSIQRSDPIR